MKLQPQNNRILIELIRLSGGSIVLPDGTTNAGSHFRVHAVAPDVTCCKAGDDVFLRPDPNIVGLRCADESRVVGLTDASTVFAVVTNTAVPEVEV